MCPKPVARLLRDAPALGLNRGLRCSARSAGRSVLCGLTFELTPTAEAGTVSRDGDDSTFGAGPAYGACRSGSGLSELLDLTGPQTED